VEDAMPNTPNVPNLSNTPNTPNVPNMPNAPNMALVIIRVGDVCEVLIEGGQKAWVKVIGIMHHQCSVFLVVRWFALTGQVHRRFHLQEFQLCNLFEHSAYFPLKAVDHQLFVNTTHFHYDEDTDLYYKNDWFFCPV
jgi:hypothetical protein